MPGERTEQATAHRREKARREGDLLVSRELTGAAALFAGVLALRVVAHTFIENWQTSYVRFLDLGRPEHWEEATLWPTVQMLTSITLMILGPTATIALTVAATALIVGIAQAGGVNFHTQAVNFKFERINPVSNLKNLFSLRAAARLAKSMIPAAIVLFLAIQKIGSQLSLPPFSLERLNNLGGEIYGLLLAATVVLFGWSAIDFLVEWQSREQRLKMSREDMREEYKETEGNPQIRGRIRNLRRQMRGNRMKNDVSRAAVVITNPTHYAVALSFDFDTMDAPRVVAKGRNLIAEEIKSTARWAGVPIMENPPLARSLYKLVEIGQAIPVDLYQTVATILAYLYRQRVDQELRERREREKRSRAQNPQNWAANNPSRSPKTTSPVSSQTQTRVQTNANSTDSNNSRPNTGQRRDSQDESDSSGGKQ